jgi:hypothetical protein
MCTTRATSCFLLVWRSRTSGNAPTGEAAALTCVKLRYWRKAAYADPSKQKIAGRWWEVLGEVEAQRKKRWSFSLSFSR